MSVSVQQILGFLRAVAPQELALDWDNVGLLVDAGQPVDGVLTTLDITPAVVREAVENDCQLIVSHHPVIFHPLRTLAADDVPALLMKNGISAICMHTNLDAAPGGVNDTLCDILGIAAEGRESFAEGCGRIGTTMPTTVEALAKFCAATLHSGVKYVNGQKPVTCLAEVSGGGGSYLEEATRAARTALSPARQPTTLRCWPSRRASALWSRATGAPSTPLPMCWPSSWKSSSRPSPSPTPRLMLIRIPTYYNKEPFPCPLMPQRWRWSPVN